MRREVSHSNFLTPPVMKESMLALEKLADVEAVAQGGYPQVYYYFFLLLCLFIPYVKCVSTDLKSRVFKDLLC